MLIFEHAVNHVNFLATVVTMRGEMSPRGPANQSRVGAFKRRQRHHRQACHHSVRPTRMGCVNHHLLRVAVGQVAQFDEQQATRRRTRRMRRTWRILKVSARAITAKFVFQNAFKNQNFLAMRVHLTFKVRMGLVSHDGRRSCHLATLPLDDFSVNPRRRRQGPVQVHGMTNNARQHVCIDSGSRLQETFHVPTYQLVEIVFEFAAEIVKPGCREGSQIWAKVKSPFQMTRRCQGNKPKQDWSSAWRVVSGWQHAAVMLNLASSLLV